MNTNNEKLEKVLSDSLELLEQGKPIPEIFSLFPEYEMEIKEMLKIIKILEKEKEEIIPKPEFLTKILSQIIDPVTNVKKNRYICKKKKGRFLKLFNKLDLLFMKKINIGLGVAFAFLFIIGGVYWQSQKSTIYPIEKELSDELLSLNQDVEQLEEINEDKEFNTLGEDLTNMYNDITSNEDSKDRVNVNITLIESLEKELSNELGDFSNDLNDLNVFEGDNSFGDLDSGLSEVIIL